MVQLLNRCSWLYGALLLALFSVSDGVAAEKQPCKSNRAIALKTNLLYDVALIPNVGVSYTWSPGWAISADWHYAWWSNNASHRFWRTYGGSLEGRRYIDERAFTGHHIGLFMQGLTYDFELAGTGYLSNFSYGAGVAYGYSLPVGHSLLLDFSVGLGYLGGEYFKYTPMDACYVWQATYQRSWWGVTKAEVSLVWVLDNIFTKRKGTKR